MNNQNTTESAAAAPQTHAAAPAEVTDVTAARVTALALDEIPDPAESAAVRAHLAADPAAATAFSEISATARLLHSAFQSELQRQQLPPAAAAPAVVRAAVTPTENPAVSADPALAHVAPPAHVAARRADATDNTVAFVPRRARAGGGFALRNRQDETPRDNVLRFALAAAATTGIAAALLVALFHPTDIARKETPAASVTFALAPPASRPGETRVHPITPGNTPAAGTDTAGTRAANATRPGDTARFDIQSAAAVHARSTLAATVARLPALTPSDGENPFQATTRPPRETPLNLAAAERDYAAQLRNVLAHNRAPARELVRVDGLVNALLAVPAARATEVAASFAAPAPPALKTHLAAATAPATSDVAAAAASVSPPAIAAGEVFLDAEAVPAPWNPGHWFVRATVRVGGTDAAPAATSARAAAIFDPAQTARWRHLGCEDGDPNAPVLGAPARLRNGDILTTLYELVPAPAARPGAPLGELKIACVLTDGRNIELRAPIPCPRDGGLAAAGTETRLAAAAATFGLALRDSAHKGRATPALARALAAPLTHPSKPILDALLRETTPL